MELVFTQVTFDPVLQSLVALTDDGRLYYKVGGTRGSNGWKRVVQTEKDD